MTAVHDIETITSAITDPKHKPYLRPVLATALEPNYDKREINEALDEFFKERTLQ